MNLKDRHLDINDFYRQLKTRKTNAFLLFDIFLERLRQLGFSLTPDHYIRVYDILHKHAQNRIPQDLKHLLCPILASTPIQQQQFYQEFDLFFPFLDDREKKRSEFSEHYPSVAKEKSVQLSKSSANSIRKWPYWFAGLLVFGVIIFSVFVNDKNTPLPQQTNPIVSQQTTNAELDGTIREENIAIAQPEQLTQHDTPHKSVIPFYLRYLRTIRYSILFGLALIIVLRECYLFNRQKLVLQKAQGKHPPFSYPIKVEEQRPHCFKSREFYNLARHLRLRLDSDLFCLDLDTTINKTISLCGFPDFHFKAMTRPPEYLILIDIPEHREHYTGYADQLVKALIDEGLFISKFFFKDDPRMCFAQPNSQRYFLSDIQQQYSDCRLILFSTGDYLLDPVTGEPNQTINDLFEFWPDRAILTPLPVNLWRLREKKLQQHFIVQPATLKGFYTLSLMFNHHILPSDTINTIPDNILPSVPENLSDMDAIQKYLGNPQTLQWLCACAMYPELHWNLTMFLGKCIHDQAIEESHLLRLIQLPWFRTGNIPDETRQILIDQISKENKQMVQNIIVDLLEKNPPPKNSYAADTYQLNLAVQRWMLHPKGKKQKHEVQNAVIDDARISKDFTLLRLLDTLPRSPLQLIIPKRLRRLFFRNALPLFGLKAGIRLLGALAIATILMIAASAPDVVSLFKTTDQTIKQPVQKEKILPATLTVNVKPPDAIIRISQVEQTYYPGMELSPGAYIIQVSKMAYASKTLTVTLLSGEHTVKDVILEEISTIKIWTEPVTQMEFVWVEGGCFMMGQTQAEKEQLIKDAGKSTYEKYYQDELPRHEVCVDGFWIGRTEVTVGQFKLFADATGYQTDAEKKGYAYGWNDNASKWDELKGNNWKKTEFEQTESHPVVNISWNDVNKLVKWLSTKSKGHFRLPSEAEWEYACRAGTKEIRYWGNNPDQACNFANVADQTAKTVFKNWEIHQCTDGYIYTAPVGLFIPNAFGLRDMLGNVWEWCADAYEKDAYSKHKRNNPIHDGTGASFRVLRGGSWYDSPRNLRSAFRGRVEPSNCSSNVGARLLRTN